MLLTSELSTVPSGVLASGDARGSWIGVVAAVSEAPVEAVVAGIVLAPFPSCGTLVPGVVPVELVVAVALLAAIAVGALPVFLGVALRSACGILEFAWPVAAIFVAEVCALDVLFTVKSEEVVVDVFELLTPVEVKDVVVLFAAVFSVGVSDDAEEDVAVAVVFSDV